MYFFINQQNKECLIDRATKRNMHKFIRQILGRRDPLKIQIFWIYILWQPTPSPANIKTTQTLFFNSGSAHVEYFCWLLFYTSEWTTSNLKWARLKHFLFKLMLYFIYSWSTLTNLAPTITCLIYYLRVLNLFSFKFHSVQKSSLINAICIWCKLVSINIFTQQTTEMLNYFKNSCDSISVNLMHLAAEAHVILLIVVCCHRDNLFYLLGLFWSLADRRIS